jgi:hypothetical protein
MSPEAVNLFLAGALSGFGPYVAVFLAEQNWTQQNIGFVLTAGGFAGLLSQLPSGELLDAIRSKRLVVALGAIMVAAGALIIALWPSFPLVLAALVLQAITGGFLGMAIAAISLGLVGHAALGKRLGRNQRFASTGGVIAAGLMGVIGFPVVSRDILRRRRAGAATARRSRPHPAYSHLLRSRLERPGVSRAERTAESTAVEPLEEPQPAYIRRLRVLVPDGQCVDAATRGRGARVQQGSSFVAHRLSVDHCPPGDRGADGTMDGPPGEHMGSPAASAYRIRGLADPCAGVRLDYRSNDSHRRSGTRRRQWNDAGHAHGADRRRPHNGYWPVQPSARLPSGRCPESALRSALHFRASWPGALAARRDFWASQQWPWPLFFSCGC